MDENIFNNPIIRKFLAQENHYDLFVRAMKHPTTENRKQVDQKFKDFYADLRLISYMASIIYYISVDFDKKIRKIKGRHPLILDQPVLQSEEYSMVDSIPSSENIEEEMISDELEEQFTDKALYDSFQALSDRQKEIIRLSYVNGMKDVDIAKKLRISQQAVSKARKKSILIMKKRWLANRGE